MLRSIGFSDDTILRYEQGVIMQVSQELRFMHPDLHPEMGVADSTASNLEHLLGPEADWDQVNLFPYQHLCGRCSLENCSRLSVTCQTFILFNCEAKNM
jgi:hypothetical protein